MRYYPNIHGSWELPQRDVCELETQRSRRCDSVKVQRPENQETDDINLSLKASEDKIWSASSSSKAGNFLLPHLLFCSGPPTLGRIIRLLNPLIEMLMSCETLHNHTKKQCLIWAFPYPPKSTHKINHPSSGYLWAICDVRNHPHSHACCPEPSTLATRDVQYHSQ